MFAINTHEKKTYSCETLKIKNSRKKFRCFWFHNHYLRWLLMVPPKDVSI